LKKYTEKIGWQIVFISRFLPGTDTDLIAYAAGIAKMGYSKFIVVSFLGMLLPTFFMAYVGISLIGSKYLFYALIVFYIIGVLLMPKIITIINFIKSHDFSDYITVVFIIRQRL
jgi:uncharacterized membrane protein YdjX (TVP38/TMEM64 family)